MRDSHACRKNDSVAARTRNENCGVVLTCYEYVEPEVLAEDGGGGPFVFWLGLSWPLPSRISYVPRWQDRPTPVLTTFVRLKVQSSSGLWRTKNLQTTLQPQESLPT